MPLAHSPVPTPVVFATTAFVFQECKTENTQLRTEMIRVCAKQVNIVKSDTGLVDLLQKNEPLAWAVLEEAEETRSKLVNNLKESKKATALSIQSGEKLVADVKRLTVENKKAGSFSQHKE